MLTPPGDIVLAQYHPAPQILRNQSHAPESPARPAAATVLLPEPEGSRSATGLVCAVPTGPIVLTD